MIAKEYSLKAGTTYSVGLKFVEEERRMIRKYHEGREIKVFISGFFFLENETVGTGSFNSFRGKL